MRKSALSCFAGGLAALGILLSASAWAAAPAAAAPAGMTRIQGAPPLASQWSEPAPSSSAAAVTKGGPSVRFAAVPDSQPVRLSVFFKRTAGQQSALEQLLRDQRDPASPDYHHWLTPAQFGQRFGADPAAVAQVTAYLKQAGLTVIYADPARQYLAVAGPAAAVQSAFATRLQNLSVRGEPRGAVNVTPLYLPSNLAPVVQSVSGLSGVRLRPAHVGRPVSPGFTSGSGAHYLTPGDLQVIYGFKKLFQIPRGNAPGQTATPQITIAIVGDSDFHDSDIASFRATAALPPTTIVRDLVQGTGPAVFNGDEVEADLDLEWAGAAAPYANLMYVYAGSTVPSVFAALQEAVTNTGAQIISMSFGACEAGVTAADVQPIRQLVQQANAQGQTVLASSGDSGAADCDPAGTATAGTQVSVDFPADVPEITGVGGTEFTGDDAGLPFWAPTNGPDGSSAQEYIPEIVWNDTAATGKLAASGGGASVLVSKPSWQTGPGVPADNARDEPDVSLSASGLHDGFLVCTSDPKFKQTNPCSQGWGDRNGTAVVLGGTSVATPVWAGILADAEIGLRGGALGNVNPGLYGALGDAALYAQDFHDVLSGNNGVPCTPGVSTGCPANGQYPGETAAPGYDPVSGIGTPAVSALAPALAADGRSVGQMTLGVADATAPSTGTTALTATLAGGAPTGSVFFSDDGSFVGSAPLNNGVATLNLSPAAAATHVFTALYTGNATTGPSYDVQSKTIRYVTGLTVTASPSPLLQGQNATVSAQVSSGGTPTGTVAFTVKGTPIGTGTVANGAAQISYQPSSLGAVQIDAAYSGDSDNRPATGSATLNVQVATTVSFPDRSVTADQPTGLSATVSAASGGAPTGTVTFSVGGAPFDTVTLANGVANTNQTFAAGTHIVTADYSGSATDAPSSTTATITATPGKSGGGGSFGGLSLLGLAFAAALRRRRAAS